MSDNQIYISKLSASLFSNELFEVKKIDVRPNKTLKLKFIFMFFYSVYPTRPSDTVTMYTIYPLLFWLKNYSNGIGSYPIASKTWLKNALHLTFWDRIFARVCFYKPSFLTLSFRHQDSNSYYLVVATAKIFMIK